MKLKPRRKVALIIESSRSYGRNLLRGVARFSRTQGNWLLLHEEMTIDAQPPDWLKDADVDGIIARVDAHSIDLFRSLNVPIIDVRCRRTYPSVPQVETDDRVVARLAFEHLYECGFRRFAFCGYRGAHFSVHRLEPFRQIVQAAGCPLSVYETDSDSRASLTSIERAGFADQEQLSQWLTEQQRPTGMLVCNDIRGQQVLNACRNLAISVPDDIGVVGVDDDDTICPLSDPPLSSVRPNAERIGYVAAETLDQMMNGQPAPESVPQVLPSGVVQRLSTQVTAVEDREVAAACRFIRQQACEGIDVGDVVQFSKLSRRQLERRFREHLGRTPHDEITATQVAKVKQLLRETELTLEAITPIAGYSHKERLSAVFKRETGLTPGRYRTQHKDSIGDATGL